MFVFSDSGFVLVARNSFWTDLFERYFIEGSEDEAKDDMIFYVRKSTAKSRLNIPQVSPAYNITFYLLFFKEVLINMVYSGVLRLSEEFTYKFSPTF